MKPVLYIHLKLNKHFNINFLKLLKVLPDWIMNRLQQYKSSFLSTNLQKKFLSQDSNFSHATRGIFKYTIMLQVKVSRMFCRATCPLGNSFFDLHYMVPKYWTHDKKRTFTVYFFCSLGGEIKIPFDINFILESPHCWLSFLTPC